MPLRSFFAGVTGLRNHQVRMDAIGSNIANVNTVGYKSSRVTFQDAYSQQIQGASRPVANGSFGTDPIQIGLGMSVGSVDMSFAQGNLQNTGINTDLAVQGDGLFIVSDGNQDFYTRAGNFQFDALGRMVASNTGLVVQGKMATAGVLVDTVTDIVLPVGQKTAALPTTSTTMGGNLDAQALTGDQRQSTITVFDSLGVPHDLTVTFTKTANPNEWGFAVTAPNGTVNGGDTGVVTFDSAGALVSPDFTDFDFTPNNITTAQVIRVNFGTAGSINGISQFASPSTAVLREQDGYTMGELRGIQFDSTGTVTGSYSNGTTQILAQVGLADFNNPGGLNREGNNLLAVSANSGQPVIGFVGEGTTSVITAGALEMSNVDLAEQFTDMITTQRGFQSISRVITTSDEMLQELVNLKR